MKPFTMWVIVDRKGRIWRRTDRSPVIWHKREDAHYDALGLDPKRGWKARRATVTVPERT